MMDEVLQRFSHLGEIIFDLLDETNLENCKKVCRSWKNFIDDPNKKFLWIQTIKKHEKSNYIKRFISGEPKWRKLKLQDLKSFAEKLKCDYKNRSICMNQSCTLFISKENDW